MRAIIKEEVNTQLPRILPQAVSDFANPVIEKNVTESLEAAVLARGVETTVTKIETPPLDQTEGRKEGSQARKLSLPKIQGQRKRSLQEPLKTPPNLNISLLASMLMKRSQVIQLMAWECNRIKSSTRDFFINNDLEYLKGGDLSRQYSTSVTKTKAVTYEIKWIKDLVQNLWSPVKDDYFRKRIIVVTRLMIMKKYDYGHLKEIEVRPEDQKLYKFREGDFPRLRLQDIEDMLLLLVQKKLTNLIIDERYDLNVALRMFTRWIVIQRRVEDLQLVVESYQKKLNLTKPDIFRSNLINMTTYTTYSDPKRVIYKDQNNRNRLMRADELHKFSDGILNDVRSALNDIAKLYERRLMRNLEKFVDGREYGNDLRLLERTI
ncbi:hypothetical protein Tco_0318327 [Tanacetum coccineum]